MNPNCLETASSGIEPGTFGVLCKRYPLDQFAVHILSIIFFVEGAARRQARSNSSTATNSLTTSTTTPQPTTTPSAVTPTPSSRSDHHRSTPSLNINVSISRTPSRGRCRVHGDRARTGGAAVGMGEQPPTYEEALRSGPPVMATAGSAGAGSAGRRAITLQRQPSDVSIGC